MESLRNAVFKSICRYSVAAALVAVAAAFSGPLVWKDVLTLAALMGGGAALIALFSGLLNDWDAPATLAVAIPGTVMIAGLGLLVGFKSPDPLPASDRMKLAEFMATCGQHETADWCLDASRRLFPGESAASRVK